MSRKVYGPGPWRRLLSVLLAVMFTLSLSGIGFAVPSGSGVEPGASGAVTLPAAVDQANPEDEGPPEEAEPPQELAGEPAPATGGREAVTRRAATAGASGRERPAVKPPQTAARSGASVSGASRRVSAAVARSDFPPPVWAPAPSGCGEMVVATLWAGQWHDAGTVSVWNDADNVYVKYVTTGGWRMTESHVYVGPDDPGTSPPGSFPYSGVHSPSLTSYVYTVPIPADWAPGTALWVAAHAVLTQPGMGTETGWAGQGTWPRLKFRFWLQDCPSYDIEVVKFDDVDGDSHRGPDEPAMGAGWMFRLTGGPPGDPVDVTRPTAADGRVVFDDLPAGDYELNEVGPYPLDDYYPTTPQPVLLTLPCDQRCDGELRIDFGNQLRLPGISIDKTVDFDGDGVFGDSETYYAGATAVWRLVVANTGGVDLWGLSVEDSNGQSYGRPGLPAGQSWEMTYATVPEGAVRNVAEVVAHGPREEMVSDSDDAWVDTISPGLSIDKTVDFDGDGIFHEAEVWYAGWHASWKLVVSNTGDVALPMVLVTDSNGRGYGPFPLASGESTTFVYTTGPIAGGVENHVRATGTDPLGRQVSDDDIAAVDTIAPGVSIEKTVDFDGDGVYSDSEAWYRGASASWRLLVTNTGDVSLPDVVVGDSNGRFFGPVGLNSGESTTFTYITGPIDQDTHNIATVWAMDPFQNQLEDTDDASVTVLVPEMALTKEVDFDGDGTFGLHETWYAGATAVWRIVVTNTGQTPLWGVTLDDSNGESFGPLNLDVGRSATVTYTTTVEEPTANVVTATAYDPLEHRLTLEAQAHADPISPGLSIDKTVDFDGDGVFTDSEEGVEGDAAVWRIVVANTGDTTLYGVEVSDSNGRSFSLGTLDADREAEPIVYETNPMADTVNVASVTAFDPLERRVGPVEDVAEVVLEPFSPLGLPDIGVVKRADKTLADPGERVVYTITYTNVSTTTAEGITITDDYDQRYAEVVNAAGGTVSGGRIVWSDPVALFPGESRSITYTMRIVADMPDGTTNVDNIVVVRTPDDTNASNDRDDWRVRVGEPFLPFTGAEGSLLALLGAALLLIGLTVRRYGREDS